MSVFNRASIRRPAIALISSALLSALVPGLASAQSAPTISAYMAGSGGATLTISGNNFGSTPSIVRIDNAEATIVTWSNTSITVDLPAGAGPGTLSIQTAQGTSVTAPFNGVERGYYLLSKSGAVTAKGGAVSYGDLTTLSNPPTSPAIQLVPTPDGKGYWILTRNGSIYPFGDATSFGSLSTPITAVGMAVVPSGTGAYVLASDGKVYPLGQAQYYGEPSSPIAASAIQITKRGQGYWILGAHGMVYPYGNAAKFSAFGGTTNPSAPVTISNNSLVKLSSAPSIFLCKNGQLYHIPNITMLKSMGRTIRQVRTVSSLASYTLGLPLVVPYKDGTLLQPSSGQTVYLVQDGVLHPVSAQVYTAIGLDAAQIRKVPGLKSNWPVGPVLTTATATVPNGSLYRIPRGAVYIVNNGKLQYIASSSVFTEMGLRWNQVRNVTKLPNLPEGPALTKPVPVLTNGTLWRQQSTSPVYLDQNGTLRHIPSAKLFQELGYGMGKVRNVSSLGNIPTGSDLGSTAIPAGTQPAASTQPTTAVDLIPTADNQGYWILLADGAINAYGDATLFGEPSPTQMGTSTALSLAVTPDQSGYTELLSNGQILNFGDAQSAPATPGAVDLTMTAGTPTNLGFLSMAYGSFMPHYDGSYQTLVHNGNALSSILPTWYYLSRNPSTLAWTIGRPPAGSSNVVAQAHSEGVQVWPMFGSTSVGPFQNSTNINRTVNLIAQTVKNNSYDGVTIDFEPTADNGLTLAQVSSQYTKFVAQLGAKLHQMGKQVMVDVYPYSYPKSPFNFQAIAASVNYINIMSYGEFDSFTEAGPNQGLGWDYYMYQAAIADGVSPSQLIMGLGPYGDYWSFNNYGLDSHAPLGNDSYVSDAQVAQLLSSNPNIVPIWDPAYGSEVFMTNKYVGTNGQWTTNPNGTAVAPNRVLSTADQSQTLGQVQNLQGLLNYILLRYAVEHHQQVPTYLNLAQDGKYSAATAKAVAQFQRDFNVTGDPAGVYGANTEAALKQVIHLWNIGEYQYWVGDTQALQNRITKVAVPDKLGGVAIWRTPFETSRYWSMLGKTVQVAPSGN